MLSRPLMKRGHSDLDWFMRVVELEHVSGIFYPLFEWGFGQENGMRGGELLVSPIHGKLIFQDRREAKPQIFESVEAALSKVDKYGWGEPPHIDEVFETALTTQAKLQKADIKGGMEILLALGEKWDILITSDRLLK